MSDTFDTRPSWQTTSQAPDSDDLRAALDVLAPEQLGVAKAVRHGRQRLSMRTRAVMWALRLYLVLMLVVVIDRFIHAVHGG